MRPEASGPAPVSIGVPDLQQQPGNAPAQGLKITLNRVDQIFAVFWVALGVLILINGRQLGYLANFGPGPGFMPFWVGLSIVALGIALFAKSIMRPSDDTVELPASWPLVQMALVIASLIGFALLAERLGFILCIFALFLFLLIAVERRGVLVSLVISVIAGAGFWFTFDYMLQMQLPAGLLGLIE